MRYGISRRKRALLRCLFILFAAFTFITRLMLTLRSLDAPPTTTTTTSNGAMLDLPAQLELVDLKRVAFLSSAETPFQAGPKTKNCATVDEMGKVFKGRILKDSLRVRKLIQTHFSVNGAPRIRELPPEQFCRHGFVIGKASEAGFGNEMYKLLTAAALSVMLNRSLIIGQTRHIIVMFSCFSCAHLCLFFDFSLFRGKYPFGDYILYSNLTFTLREVKHLWRKNGCLKKYGRHLVMRIDDFEKPTKTNALCGNWRKWPQPIIWYQGTTDAVAAQFFLKNVHPDMRNAVSELFGKPESLQSRPNVFGELMRILISPSRDVEEAVNWVIGNGGRDPDITLHMRMLMNRSVRAAQAALNCLKRAIRNLQQGSRPRVVVISDTPSFIKGITPNISEVAEVMYPPIPTFPPNTP
ncbi:hypothetical protein Gotri_027822 [Gossypium trilobum]|uniref:Uncharacterized protein n=1 Tax=Gossypium trilobum TaxID=34281 RepID=A0A7J9FU79_9ROSI|nr:hypothetical protein [Gossypium trilobum]